MKNPLTLIIIFIWCIFSCQNDSKAPESEPPLLTTTSLDGTAKMVKLLEEAKAKINPMKVAYFSNRQRADFYQKKISQAKNLGEELTGMMFLGYELLNAGENEEAIVKLSELLQKMDGKVNDEAVITQVKRLLALAYMRLGEQNNCFQNANDESCIMPIQDKGIYTLTIATESAIGIYMDMLKSNPDDLESIWMLNFAYMTLGKYPEKVPAQFRLPATFFKSDANFPKFKNVGGKVGLSTMGLSGGVAIDDFNNDGFLDIVASSWGFDDQLRIFFNEGNGHFIDVTETAGILGITGGLNVNHADYNNDGFLDIFVMRGAWFGGEGRIPNSLLKNNGDGTFTDVTVETGLLSYAPTQTSAWADFNLDGNLDLFVGTESERGVNFSCELYMNNGNGTFTNLIASFGLEKLYGMIKGVTAGDVNNDGRPDLYLSILGQKNFLLINQGVENGIVKFMNVTDEAGVSEPLQSFPTWLWDFNNDGWQDIMVASFGNDQGAKPQTAADVAANALGKEVGSHPRFYMNNQDGTFSEKSKEFGVREAIFAMGSNYGDIDNDGYLDIYYGTGAPSFTAIVPNKMYRNNQGKSLQDITTTTGTGHIQKGHGVGFGDLDNDGDQDIFCVLGGAFEGDVFADALFLNPFGNENNWITLKLVGTTSNRSAIGAKVKIVAENIAGKKQTIYHWVSSGGSFGGNSLQLEVGLGDADRIESIEVIWPNKTLTKQTFENIEVNRKLIIMEDSSEIKYVEMISVTL